MRPLLLPGGMYVAINGSPSDWIRGMLEKFLFRRYNVSIQRKAYDLFLVTPTSADLDRISSLIDSGKIPATHIDHIYDLKAEDLDAAFARMKSRRTVGKIAFRIIS